MLPLAQMKMQKIGLLSEQEKRKAIDALIAYFSSERGEEIGIIAAEDILDQVLEQVGTKIYNKGVDAVVKSLRMRLGDLISEVEVVEKK